MTMHSSWKSEHRQTTVRERPSATKISPLLPRLSVILCTYNRRNLVLSALASLRRQTLPYQQFEVIVVDNGSTDGTLSAVHLYVNAGPAHTRDAEHIWQVRCLSEARNGLAYARNTGLQAATGEIAVFLDDDTLAEPHFLETLLQAYEETEADAIGGQVDLRWESSRPYWLTDDLLDLLGYFAPAKTRMMLPQAVNFSSCCFSVRIDALQAIDAFSPFLSKREAMPTSMDVDDLCRRLRQQNYTLWYEPTALVRHRVPAARLKRPYFVGRAYWQGRSEVVTEYINTRGKRNASATLAAILPSLLQEARQLVRLTVLERPLLALAVKPTHEQIVLAMAQARSWGHVRQRIQFLLHAPLDIQTPAVLLVRPTTGDASATLLTHALQLLDIACTPHSGTLPLSWLWRYRTSPGKSRAIIHLYRPGALHLAYWQQQRLLFLLWLARRWNIRIVCTDTGGWWQNARHLRFLAQRSFEYTCLRYSDSIIAFTHEPDQLYPDKKLRRNVRCLPHPGFYGYLPVLQSRQQAQQQLGLPQKTGCVYLCFAHLHTEQELVHLMHAFAEIETAHTSYASTMGQRQLLLVGMPKDTKNTKDVRRATELFKQAALNSCVHLFLHEGQTLDFSLYVGAAHAIVIPHFASRAVGIVETAILAVSYERYVIAPDLPRFRGMIPSRLHTLYDPTSRTALSRALAKAQARDYHLLEREIQALDAVSSWQHHARRVAEIYKQIAR